MHSLQAVSSRVLVDITVSTTETQSDALNRPWWCINEVCRCPKNDTPKYSLWASKCIKKLVKICIILSALVRHGEYLCASFDSVLHHLTQINVSYTGQKKTHLYASRWHAWVFCVRTYAKYKDSKIERLGLSVITGTGKCLVCLLLKGSGG